MATPSGNGSPVDDETYDLLQTLTSKLEAIELYQHYEEDCQGEAQMLFQEMAEGDRGYAERIVSLLRDRFAELESARGR
jgi:hypothetical protein